MALSEDQVNIVYKKVLDVILVGLESKELEVWEASEIAEYAIGQIGGLETESDYQKFFEELADLWPFLEILLDDKKMQDQKNVEKEISQGALNLLQHGKVEDALNLVKTVTN